ncbi:MAG: hypothetical protein H7Y07_15135 [Pyrinomonadaceae bacterium]|nr:hypothetical protein [Sphingobacteriaceae bacterium]
MKYLYFLIASILLLSACKERVSLNETDVTKYPWLKPFIHNNILDFEGEHDIDLGILYFSYKSSLMEENSFLFLDRVAHVNGWKLDQVTKINREYSKHLHQFEADTGKTIIRIELDTLENRLRYEVD